MIDQIAGSFDRATAPCTGLRTCSPPSPAGLVHAAVRGRPFAPRRLLADRAQDELVTLYRAARDHTTPVLPDVGSYVDFSAGTQARRRDRPPTIPRSRRGRRSCAPDTARCHGSPLLNAGCRRCRAPTPPHPRPSRDRRRIPHRTPARRRPDQPGSPRSVRGGRIAVRRVLSALAIVYHDMTGDTEFRCVMPRHTREGPEWLALARLVRRTRTHLPGHVRIRRRSGS